MSTSWTETASQVCDDALEHLGVLASGETATAADTLLALKALDGILKELPLVGFTWPKLSGEVALTYTSAQTMTLPTDFYGNAIAWKLIGTQRVPLERIPHANWVQIPDRTQAGTTTHFYISPAKVFYIYPFAATDPSVTIQYQKIVDDAVSGTAPDLPQYWLKPLGWGVADQLSLKFGKDQATRVELAARWKSQRELAIQNSIASEPISFEVRD